MRLRDRPDGDSNRLHGSQWRDEERAGLQHDLSTDGAAMSGRASKRPAPRDRMATPAELEDERKRWLRAKGPTIRALRAGHRDTVEVPVLSMAELVESRLAR
jgi:hypothetical protein